MTHVPCGVTDGYQALPAAGVMEGDVRAPGQRTAEQCHGRKYFPEKQDALFFWPPQALVDASPSAQ